MSRKQKTNAEKKSYTWRSLFVCFFIGILVGTILFGTVYATFLKSVMEQNLADYAEEERKIFVGTEFNPEEPLDEFDGIFVKVSSNVDTKKVGQYQVIYKVLFGKEFTKSIKVIDSQPPTIKLLGDRNCTVQGSFENWEDPGAVAYDDTDGDITLKIKTKITQLDEETYEILYRVSDFSGYERTARRYVVVEN